MTALNRTESAGERDGIVCVCVCVCVGMHVPPFTCYTFLYVSARVQMTTLERKRNDMVWHVAFALYVDRHCCLREQLDMYVPLYNTSQGHRSVRHNYFCVPVKKKTTTTICTPGLESTFHLPR